MALFKGSRNHSATSLPHPRREVRSGRMHAGRPVAGRGRAPVGREPGHRTGQAQRRPAAVRRHRARPLRRRSRRDSTAAIAEVTGVPAVDTEGDRAPRRDAKDLLDEQIVREHCVIADRRGGRPRSWCSPPTRRRRAGRPSRPRPSARCGGLVADPATVRTFIDRSTAPTPTSTASSQAFEVDDDQQQASPPPPPRSTSTTRRPSSSSSAGSSARRCATAAPTSTSSRSTSGCASGSASTATSSRRSACRIGVHAALISRLKIMSGDEHRREAAPAGRPVLDR